MQKSMESTKLAQWLCKRLKPSRYTHSLGVAEMAGELMKRFGYSEEAGIICGIYHDAYRYIDPEEGRKLCRENGMELYPEELIEDPIVHAAVAGAMMKKDLGAVPEPFIKAVRFHTLGSRDMTKLGACVYIADYAEKGRKHLTEREREEILSLPTLEAMVLHIITEQDRYFEKTGKKGALVTEELAEFLSRGGKFEEDISFSTASSFSLASHFLQ